MKVGILGSGGIEHAICQTINKSKKVNKIYKVGNTKNADSRMLQPVFVCLHVCCSLLYYR